MGTSGKGPKAAPGQSNQGKAAPGHGIRWLPYERPLPVPEQSEGCVEGTYSPDHSFGSILFLATAGSLQRQPSDQNHLVFQKFSL